MIHNKPFAYTARTISFRGTYQPKRPMTNSVSQSTHAQNTKNTPKDISTLKMLASLTLLVASIVGTMDFFSGKSESMPYNPPINAPEVAFDTTPNNVPYSTQTLPQPLSPLPQQPQQPVPTTTLPTTLSIPPPQNSVQTNESPSPNEIFATTRSIQNTQVQDTVIMTGQSVNGKTIELHQVGPFNPSVSGQKILIIGAIHGNEYKKLPEHLTEAIMKNPSMMAGNTLYYIPELNPDGVASSSRQNANNVDLNRNFPASNWANGTNKGPSPGSEPETQFAMKVIESIQPDLVIDVHSDLNTIFYFGSKSESIAKKMAADMGYSAADSATPGALCSWSPSPCVILEVDGGHGESNYDRIFNKVGNALVKLMSNQYTS